MIIKVSVFRKRFELGPAEYESSPRFMCSWVNTCLNKKSNGCINRTLGAFTQTLLQGKRYKYYILCVCLCVWVCMEYVWVGVCVCVCVWCVCVV
jgi:hypothetical protein